MSQFNENKRLSREPWLMPMAYKSNPHAHNAPSHTHSGEYVNVATSAMATGKNSINLDIEIRLRVVWESAILFLRSIVIRLPRTIECRAPNANRPQKNFDEMPRTFAPFHTHFFPLTMDVRASLWCLKTTIRASLWWHTIRAYASPSTPNRIVHLFRCDQMGGDSSSCERENELLSIFLVFVHDSNSKSEVSRSLEFLLVFVCDHFKR